jgi:uncharacterized protein (UPF0332 family)
MEPYDEIVADYSQQARAFLSKSREYLDDGDLHQAAEKGWGAAAWMAKAVAEAHGWEYKKHDQFFEVMYRARDLSGDARLDYLRALANELHGFFYTRKRFLHPDVIERGLDQMETLLGILQPLTGAGR